MLRIWLQKIAEPGLARALGEEGVDPEFRPGALKLDEELHVRRRKRRRWRWPIRSRRAPASRRRLRTAWRAVLAARDLPGLASVPVVIDTGCLIQDVGALEAAEVLELLQ